MFLLFKLQNQIFPIQDESSSNKPTQISRDVHQSQPLQNQIQDTISVPHQNSSATIEAPKHLCYDVKTSVPKLVFPKLNLPPLIPLSSSKHSALSTPSLSSELTEFPRAQIEQCEHVLLPEVPVIDAVIPSTIESEQLTYEATDKILEYKDTINGAQEKTPPQVTVEESTKLNEVTIEQATIEPACLSNAEFIGVEEFKDAIETRNSIDTIREERKQLESVLSTSKPSVEVESNPREDFPANTFLVLESGFESSMLPPTEVSEPSASASLMESFEPAIVEHTVDTTDEKGAQEIAAVDSSTSSNEENSMIDIRSEESTGIVEVKYNTEPVSASSCSIENNQINFPIIEENIQIEINSTKEIANLESLQIIEYRAPLSLIDFISKSDIELKVREVLEQIPEPVTVEAIQLPIETKEEPTALEMDIDIIQETTANPVTGMCRICF